MCLSASNLSTPVGTARDVSVAATGLILALIAGNAGNARRMPSQATTTVTSMADPAPLVDSTDSDDLS